MARRHTAHTVNFVLQDSHQLPFKLAYALSASGQQGLDFGFQEKIIATSFFVNNVNNILTWLNVDDREQLAETALRARRLGNKLRSLNTKKKALERCRIFQQN